MFKRKLPESVNLEKSLETLQGATDTILNNSWLVEFRKFLMNDKIMGFAIGVIVGNTFTDVVQAFVKLITGIIHFFGLLIFDPSHNWQWQVIPINDFVVSFLSMLLVAGSVFFFIKLLNNVWARDETEQFGYNAQYVEIKKLHDEQEKTNQLLRELIDKMADKNEVN